MPATPIGLMEYPLLDRRFRRRSRYLGSAETKDLELPVGPPVQQTKSRLSRFRSRLFKSSPEHKDDQQGRDAKGQVYHQTVPQKQSLSLRFTLKLASMRREHLKAESERKASKSTPNGNLGNGTKPLPKRRSLGNLFGDSFRATKRKDSVLQSSSSDTSRVAGVDGAAELPCCLATDTEGSRPDKAPVLPEMENIISLELYPDKLREGPPKESREEAPIEKAVEPVGDHNDAREPSRERCINRFPSPVAIKIDQEHFLEAPLRRSASLETLTSKPDNMPPIIYPGMIMGHEELKAAANGTKLREVILPNLFAPPPLGTEQDRSHRGGRTMKDRVQDPEPPRQSTRPSANAALQDNGIESRPRGSHASSDTRHTLCQTIEANGTTPTVIVTGADEAGPGPGEDGSSEQSLRLDRENAFRHRPCSAEEKADDWPRYRHVRKRASERRGRKTALHLSNNQAQRSNSTTAERGSINERETNADGGVDDSDTESTKSDESLDISHLDARISFVSDGRLVVAEVDRKRDHRHQTHVPKAGETTHRTQKNSIETWVDEVNGGPVEEADVQPKIQLRNGIVLRS